jgi:DNA polymerase-4
VLTLDDLPTRIWPLPARRINGIGPKAAAKLESLGIRTVGELAACERGWLVERFGRSWGPWLHDAAHGIDERPVVTHSEPVSISRETTFDRNLHARRDRAELGRQFTQLCERLAADLQRKGYAARTIGIKLRFDDFRTVTRDHTLPAAIDDARGLRHAAGQCLRRVALEQPIRLLGVRAASLQRRAGEPSPPAEHPARATAAGAPRRPADAEPELPLFDETPAKPVLRSTAPP